MEFIRAYGRDDPLPGVWADLDAAKAGPCPVCRATPTKRGRPKTGVKTPWKELNISKATYYRRIRSL